MVRDDVGRLIFDRIFPMVKPDAHSWEWHSIPMQQVSAKSRSPQFTAIFTEYEVCSSLLFAELETGYCRMAAVASERQGRKTLDAAEWRMLPVSKFFLLFCDCPVAQGGSEDALAADRLRILLRSTSEPYSPLAIRSAAGRL